MQNWELVWEHSRDIEGHVSLESLDTHRFVLGLSPHFVPQFDERQWHRHKLTQLKLIYKSHSIETRSFYFVFFNFLFFWFTSTQYEKLSMILFHSLCAPRINAKRKNEKRKATNFTTRRVKVLVESKWGNQKFERKMKKASLLNRKIVTRLIANCGIHSTLYRFGFRTFFTRIEWMLGMRCG